jgi:cardiolipin synthase A/B
VSRCPPDNGAPAPDPGTSAGAAALRVVATVPYMGGLFRLDQLLAVLAPERLRLTDAY